VPNLRKEARGRDCQVRAEVCNGDPDTTVLAHFRHIGISGAGLKSPDILGAWACSNCHDLVDKRIYTDTMNATEVEHAHLMGLVRTLYQLWKEGKVKP
jgi:hypothetical protein